METGDVGEVLRDGRGDPLEPELSELERKLKLYKGVGRLGLEAGEVEFEGLRRRKGIGMLGSRKIGKMGPVGLVLSLLPNMVRGSEYRALELLPGEVAR